ncbi:MAG: tyrosine--tRNA ligase [Candidatus Omnitrophica bacterium]|nr:tyrosine--tRNA ligase [Candidatus Omnitrophota bacterium]
MTVDEQLRVFCRDTVDCIDEADLEQKLARSLKEKKPLKIKYGADPSSPHLHLGHTVPLRKLRAIQELGHQIIFLIGDFTARIGDPSQQYQTRPKLGRSEIAKNAKTYQEQVFRILDRKRTKVVYNSAWLDNLKPDDFLSLMSQYTVARILERDDFSRRYKDKKPITLLEFMYPLLQGYDSVELKSDVELGGTDQKFNLLVGRELQRLWNQEPQVVLTLPILEGTDGERKMSKSLGNAIGLEDTPTNMFGGLMSIPDKLIARYFRYLTDTDEKELKALEGGLESGKLHPRKEKARLANCLVSMYHGAGEAARAEAEFDRVFKSGDLPDEIQEYRVKEMKMDLVSLLAKVGLAESKGAARRLIQQGAVEVDRRLEKEPTAVILLNEPRLIRCGKRKFARVSGVTHD